MKIELDPHNETAAYEGGVRAVDEGMREVFRKQKARAVYAATLNKMQVFKADDDASDYDASEVFERIYEAVSEEFLSVPAVVRPALEEAVLAGISHGIIQLEIHDSKLIASANTIAADYARDRAAELVGMKYDGRRLVPNPNAQWAISDTTREKLKRIVTEAFEGETKISDIVKKIQSALETDKAGIFTIERAQMIAETEVAFAQAHGNWATWEKSGLVKKVTWGVSAEGPCDVCEENEGVEVEFGQEFPSGDRLPPAHPSCRCVIFVTRVDGD